jgi:arsenate reductase (glutaredoxin)
MHATAHINSAANDTRRPPLTLYGIATCDKVRKARAWLDARDIPYHYVDIKTHPPSHSQLWAWCEQLSPDRVLNRQGTTWRSLSAFDRFRSFETHAAVDLITKHPMLMRRPMLVLMTVDKLELAHAGFREEEYAVMMGDDEHAGGEVGP